MSSDFSLTHWSVCKDSEDLERRDHNLQEAEVVSLQEILFSNPFPGQIYQKSPPLHYYCSWAKSLSHKEGLKPVA